MRRLEKSLDVRVVVASSLETAVLLPLNFGLLRSAEFA
jgi:hypothetical protein